jgi:ABC-type sugar transport system ATPase subunit
MAELRRIADRITVLRDGLRVGTQPANELSNDDLVAMMIGRKLNQMERPGASHGPECLLEVTGLSTEFISDITFHLRAREVLGIAGLVGAGRSELGAALFGLRRKVSGKIKLNGHVFRASGPAEAIRQGLCLLPEDRRWAGISQKCQFGRTRPSLCLIDCVAQDCFKKRRDISRPCTANLRCLARLNLASPT